MQFDQYTCSRKLSCALIVTATVAAALKVMAEKKIH